MNVLVVVESEFLRASLCGVIAGMDGVQSVRCSRTLLDAFRKTAAAPPALIIVDFPLVDGNTRQAIDTFRKFAPDAAVAVCADDVGNMIREACLQGGANYFCDKTRDVVELLEIVQRAAQRFAGKTNFSTTAGTTP